MVELALAFRDQDGNYAEHAAVVLTSVFRNTDAQITVHILHDETLTDLNRLRITQLVMAHNHTVHFYPVFLPIDLAELVDGAQSVTTWTRGACTVCSCLLCLMSTKSFIWIVMCW
ncbi:hypothetical protein RE628_04385 [Paenibacillus sp. D2_2]|uniref:hypothetical protein n=1 Tax=Paenibacillus sp. D2_2 TaxID=3073092 RepID=UPI002816756D|nr:hypothetical protein [Paenibacillus sp. D2_2]WMT41735.1 hypothetical protein RE628_04385 [Paenibacillus sp. D2_2]